MAEPDPLAPVTDLGDGDALEPWRFLAGDKAKVRLLTAMGDLFLLRPHGLLRREQVFLLDTGSGELRHVGADWQTFKQRMANPDAEVADWLKFKLLCDLHDAGKILELGQCYSPTLPPLIGGKYDVANFEPTSWRLHLQVTGQICAQVKDLPPGTPITGIDIKWK